LLLLGLFSPEQKEYFFDKGTAAQPKWHNRLEKIKQTYTFRIKLTCNLVFIVFITYI
jgi:hypothetical protein